MRALPVPSILICVTVLASSAIAAAPANAPKPVKSDQALIASAMSAAPLSISKDATVITMDAKGAMRALRKGSNDWTCMPDEPSSPGDDPMCADPNGWEWTSAWMAHRPPPDKVGFIYMLKGGSDASNIDPYANSVAKGSRWVTTGPHVMIVGPSVKNMPGYSAGANPDTTKPYAMYRGTPYEHLMIPVK